MKIALASAVVVMLLLGNPIQMPAQEPETRLEILDHWQGVFRENTLLDQRPELPFILDDEAWERVWNLWRPEDDVPEIDFETELVLVATVRGPNRLRGGAFLHPNGDVELRVGGTRVGGPGFGYLLMQVEREGIRSVSGESLSPADDGEAPAEYIAVEIKGQLRTGVFAIGGETTGVVILASNLTFELDFGDDAELQKAAEDFNGQTVLVTGQLEGRRGLEIPVRQVINVDSLIPASAGDDDDDE